VLRRKARSVYGWWKMKGGKNSDLRIGHVRLQLECIRTHVSAFDCTRAEYIRVKCALRSNITVDVRTHSCNSVCVWWGVALEHTQVSSYVTPRLHSNVYDMFERRVHSKQIFFFKIFTK
jgi:hypothetical protein